MNKNDCSIDLHCHTNASDGALSPEQIVERAVRFGITHLAISDHDTTSGILRAQNRALLDDFKGQIEIIPSIEISTTFTGHQIHIVGLFINPLSQAMTDLVAAQFEKRKERASRIALKLEKLGFDNIAEEIAKDHSPDDVITRGNFARYIFEKGAASSFDEAFNKYLKRGKPAYVNSQWIGVDDAVKIIHMAGGIAVLAHPGRYQITNAKLRELICFFKDAGGEAMEICSCQQKPAERDFLANLAVQYGMLGSAGSDFHLEGAYRELGYNIALPMKVTPIWEDPRFAKFFNNLDRAVTGRK